MAVAVPLMFSSAMEFAAIFMVCLMPTTSMVSPPFPVRDVPFMGVDASIVMGNAEHRTRDVMPVHEPPRSVIGTRPVPPVTAWTPPVAVIEEDVELKPRHEIDLTAGHQDHFRRRRGHNRRRSEVNPSSAVIRL